MMHKLKYLLYGMLGWRSGRNKLGRPLPRLMEKPNSHFWWTKSHVVHSHLYWPLSRICALCHSDIRAWVRTTMHDDLERKLGDFWENVLRRLQ